MRMRAKNDTARHRKILYGTVRNRTEKNAKVTRKNVRNRTRQFCAFSFTFSHFFPRENVAKHALSLDRNVNAGQNSLLK